MNETTKTEQESVLSSVIKDILSNVSQEREKEIISRRFGLYDRKETLERLAICWELPASASASREGDSGAPAPEYHRRQHTVGR